MLNVNNTNYQNVNPIGPVQEEDIVIVGGGMSGLTTAYALQKLGIKSALYEGRDRLGGRTHTHYFNDNKTAFY